MGEENHVPAAVETEAAKPEEQKHGVCPYCGAVKAGLVWDFFDNVAQLGGHLMKLNYGTCSCEKCGKIISAVFGGMQPADVQPADHTNLLIVRRHRH